MAAERIHEATLAIELAVPVSIHVFPTAPRTFGSRVADAADQLG